MSWLLLTALRQERAYICWSAQGTQWVGAILDWIPSVWTSILYDGKKEIIKEGSTAGEKEERKEGGEETARKEKQRKEREGATGERALCIFMVTTRTISPSFQSSSSYKQMNMINTTKQL